MAAQEMMMLLSCGMFRRLASAMVCVALLVAAGGCVRREGRNSDCRWPGESPLQAATPRHLSADAEFAEDLAIRYSDTHFGLRSPGFVSWERYNSARITCAQKLFAQVAQAHAVPVSTVRASLGRNRAGVNIAVYLPFLAIYCLAAFFIARITWRRNSPDEVGWMPGTVLVVFVSLLCAALATMIGETWALLAESLRVGTGHLSYRAERIAWAHHRSIEFLGLFLLFLVAATAAVRLVRRPLRTEAEPSALSRQ